MNPIRQGFLGLWYLSACATHLRRVVWRNGDHLTASFCRFTVQDTEKAAPTNIIGRFGKPGLGNACYVQLLVGNHAVTGNQGRGCLVVKIPSLVGDMLMLLLEQSSRFPTASTAFLASRQLALRSSESLLRCAVELGWLDLFPFTGHEEGSEPQVNAHGRQERRRTLAIRQFTRKDDMPAIGFPFERYGFDLALQVPMPLDFERPHMLNVEPTLFELAPIAIGGEDDRIKAVLALQARIARVLLAIGNAAEEVLKGMLKAFQSGLTTGKVGGLHRRIGEPIFLEMSRLLLIRHRTMLLLIDVFAFSQSAIVQVTMRLDHRGKRLRLLLVWVQSVLERFAHLLFAPCLLLCNIALDRFFRDQASTANVVGTAPQGRQTSTQVSKLLSQEPGCDPFELVRNLLRGQRRRRIHEDLHVIGHHFHGFDLDTQGSRLRVEYLSQGSLNWPDQHWLAILGTPDKVILQVVDTTCMLVIAWRTHVLCIPRCQVVVKQLTE